MAELANNEGWVMMRESLAQELREWAAYQELPEQETAIVEQFLQLLGTSTAPSGVDQVDLFFGLSLVEWLKLNLLPSEYIRVIGTILERGPTDGRDQFLFGLCSARADRVADAKKHLDDALKDETLPGGLRIIAIELKVWCNVRLEQFDQAFKILLDLRNIVSSENSRYCVDLLTGYVTAMGDYGVGLSDTRRFTTVPVTVDGEFPNRRLEEKSTPAITLSDLSKLLEKEVTLPLRLTSWKLLEEIKAVIPRTQTLEEMKYRMFKEHGDWIDKLENQGELVNAEFLFEALGKKSWGTVVMGYSNSLDGEIKVRLWPLVECLRRHEVRIIPTEKDDIKLSDIRLNMGEAALVLRIIGSNPLLKAYITDFVPHDYHVFLFQELPEKLQQVNEARSKLGSCASRNLLPSVVGAAHGAKLAHEIAKEVRELVLGTPNKPGILKRLCEIQLEGKP